MEDDLCPCDVERQNLNNLEEFFAIHLVKMERIKSPFIYKSPVNSSESAEKIIPKKVINFFKSDYNLPKSFYLNSLEPGEDGKWTLEGEWDSGVYIFEGGLINNAIARVSPYLDRLESFVERDVKTTDFLPDARLFPKGEFFSNFPFSIPYTHFGLGFSEEDKTPKGFRASSLDILESVACNSPFKRNLIFSLLPIAYFEYTGLNEKEFNSRIRVDSPAIY
jgi:hypothetical protein